MLPPHPEHPGRHLDPETGIFPIHEWAGECRRGFVSNERFARPGDRVIKRTNRSQQRKRKQRTERAKSLHVSS